MRIVNTLITLTALLFLQCKASHTTQNSDNIGNLSESIPIVLLLVDGVSPIDLEPIKEMEIESTKRTSRSQNLWMIKVIDDMDSVENLLSKLKEDKRVVRASFNQKNKGSSTFKNTKSPY